MFFSYLWTTSVFIELSAVVASAKSTDAAKQILAQCEIQACVSLLTVSILSSEKRTAHSSFNLFMWNIGRGLYL